MRHEGWAAAIGLILWAGALTMNDAGAGEAEKPGETHLAFSFAGDAALAGWSRTQTVTPTVQAEWLDLAGKGWDSKLYRQIQLPAGHYVMSACGRGKVLAIQLQETSWEKGKRRVDLNLARDDWRTDWRPFDTDGADLFLIVSVGGQEPVESALKWLKIDSAEILPDTDVPSPEALEKERPVPPVVRGATIGGIGSPKCAQNLMDLGQMGANVVRFWVKVKPVKDGKGLAELGPDWEETLNQVEATVLAAQAAGLKVVPTLGGEALADQYKASEYDFWTSPELTPKFCRIWQDIVRKLQPHKDVVWAYDLYNEPLDWSQMPYAPRQWREVAKAAVKAIREVDADSWLVYECGPGGMEWGFNGLKPLPDTHIVYSTHFYSPHEFTHQGIHNITGTDLAEAKTKLNVHYPSTVNGLLWDKAQIEHNLAIVARFQEQYRVPILLGEFSVVRWAPKEDGERYLTDLVDIFEGHGWSWIYHAFREFDGWSFEYGNEFYNHFDESWRKKFPAPKPEAEETERARIIKGGWAKNRAAAQ